MSHIHVRKAIDGQTEYAGQSWWYDFRSLPEHFEDERVIKYCQSISRQFAALAKRWDDNLNSEWICRIYFAAKMVLASSVMAESLEFAGKSNLRIVESYLEYYVILNSLRSILITHPTATWDEGGLLTASHSKTINTATDFLSLLDRELAEPIKEKVLHLKAYRELITYRAPSSGDGFLKPGFDVMEYSRLFLEVAQMQSELMENSIAKHAKGTFTLKDDEINRICLMEIGDFKFFDKEDAYRLDYLRRKYPIPTNIQQIMSEGHVEDFFGSWCADDEKKGHFNPDEDWRILFDVP